MFRRLFIYMLLFILPLQGQAVTCVIHCALSSHGKANVLASIEEAPLSHQHPTDLAYDTAETKNAEHTYHHAGLPSGDASIHTHHHANHSDSSHAYCSGAVALVANAHTFVLAVHFAPTPHNENILPIVFLEGPQRPPRPLFV